MSLGRALAGSLLVATCACRADENVDVEPPRPTPRHGMVVCEHPLAAKVGVGVLERGGNAADAAVATAFALAVVYPQAGNLGGGGFALWVPHSGEPRALDFRETAPSDADARRYFDAQGGALPARLLTGPLAVGVPGSPAGLHELHRLCGSGRFEFATLIEPAIELARSGFTVDDLLAADLRAASTRERMSQNPGASALFQPKGEPLRAGARLVQRELAATLERLARSGPDAFYRGEIAREIVAELELAAQRERAGDPSLDGGWIRSADLAGYAPKWREPLRGWFRGQEVITMPPPSSGGAILLQVLGLLDGFPLDAERRDALARGRAGEHEPSGLNARAAHWWIEALRTAFAARASVMGDPDFVEVPLAELLSSTALARRRVAIGERYRAAPVEPVAREGENTTHLSVIDESGNALSLTTTLNSTFGSGMLVRGAGFLLNNELDDFALGGPLANQFGLVGGTANAIEPRKRPLSSMTPTVVRRGGHTVSYVLGSPGGPRIPTAVLAVFLRTLVYGQTLEDAVSAPRFHQQWSPIATEFEPGWPAPLLEDLRRREQPIQVVERRWASVQAIKIGADRSVTGVSDPRRGGVALAARPRKK